MQTISNYLRTTKKVYDIVDTLAYHSKSLYNVGLYNARQYYMRYREASSQIRDIRPDIYSGITFAGSFLPYTRGKNHLHKDLSNYVLSKSNENYGLMHSQSAQQTLKSIQEAYVSFFNSPGAKPPNYLDKNGRYKVVYPRAGITFNGNTLTLGMSFKFKQQYELTGKELTFSIPKSIKAHQIREVSLTPTHDGKCYKVEYSYELPEKKAQLDETKFLSIDLGLDNFATIVENATGTATIIDGKYLKSINRWYNKEMARLQSTKDRQGLKHFTKEQSRITIRRNNQIDEALNRFVNYIVQFAIEYHIGNIVLPKWDGIKQDINHGPVNNQNFVQIPYDSFRRKLGGKCKLYSIAFHDEHDEAYTSQTDALAFDEIEEQPYGKSRRVERGLYRSITGIDVNADVNGALNHIRNVAGDSPVKEIIGSGRFNRPVRVRIAYEEPRLQSAQTNLQRCKLAAMSQTPRCNPPVKMGGS